MTMVSDIRKSVNVHPCRLSGILKEHASQEILKELTENWGLQREPPHSVIPLLTLWLWNEHLVSAALTYFFPKSHSSVYSEDCATVTAAGRLVHRMKHEKQRWIISQKHRADSMKWIKLVLNAALGQGASGEVRLERGNISKDKKQ